MSLIDELVGVMKGAFNTKHPIKDQVVKTAGKEIKDIDVFKDVDSLDDYGPKSPEVRELLKGWPPEDLEKSMGYVGMNDNRFSPLMNYINKEFDNNVPVQFLYNLVTPNKTGARPISADKVEGGLVRREEVDASGVVGLLQSHIKEGKKFISKEDLLKHIGSELPILRTEKKMNVPDEILRGGHEPGEEPLYTSQVESIVNKLIKERNRWDQEDFRYLAAQNKIDAVNEYVGRGKLNPDKTRGPGDYAIETGDIPKVKFGGIYNEDVTNDDAGAAFYEYIVRDGNWKGYSDLDLRDFKEGGSQNHWSLDNGLPVAHGRGYSMTSKDGNFIHLNEIQSDLANAEKGGAVSKGANKWGNRYPGLVFTEVLMDSIKKGNKFMTIAMGQEAANSAQQRWTMKNPTITSHYARTDTGPDLVYSFDFLDNFTGGGRFAPRDLKKRRVTLTASEVKKYAENNPELAKAIEKVDLSSSTDRAFFPYEEGKHIKVDFSGTLGTDNKMRSYGGTLDDGSFTQGTNIKIIKDIVGKYGGTIKPWKMPLPPAYDKNGVAIDRKFRDVWRVEITPEMGEKIKASGGKMPQVSKANPAKDWIKQYNISKGYA